MVKSLVVVVLLAVFSGVALAYCHVDPVCKMQCERQCFAQDFNGNCIQYCNNVCQMCN